MRGAVALAALCFAFGVARPQSAPPLLRGAATDATAPADAAADPTQDPTQAPIQDPTLDPSVTGDQPGDPPPLPPLAPYRGAKLPASTEPPPPPTVAAIPAPPPARRAKPDDDPFAPLGVDAAGVLLHPSISLSGGYDDNPGEVSPGKGSAFLRGEIGLDANSDWARHAFEAKLRAGYTDYPSLPGQSAPDASGDAKLRLDATRDLSLDGELRFTVETQSPQSPTVSTGGTVAGTGRPAVYTQGLTLGGTQKFGALALGLHGTLDRTEYADERLADGTSLALSKDDYTQYGLVGRIDWASGAVVSPYAEIEGDLRRHDSALDVDGYARNSSGLRGALGADLALDGDLTGHAAFGYGLRRYA
ncbi:MAG: outer membrane beta-barrel protein, partial [Hyphomicrobiales bacterium]|nr:outer membrane beta-barrel protein [Hyphomicrobiales bacterium]